MRIKIKPFLLRLIKENFLYLLILSLLIILFFYVNFSFLLRINENNTKIDQAKNEVIQLEKKVSFLNKSINFEKLEEYIKILNHLIPYEENVFSIIFTLENLSQKTGFIIQNYTINLTSTNKNQLNILVSGAGSKENFFNFLKDYHLNSGRLINSKEINFSEGSEANTVISLYFYSDKKLANQTTDVYDYQITEQNFKKIDNILKKIDLKIFEEEKNKGVVEDYPKKSNPF